MHKTIKPFLRIAQEAGDRLVVSAESDILWLQKFMADYSNDYHQFLLVPAYSDLVGCYGNNPTVKFSNKDLDILGHPPFVDGQFTKLKCS